MSLPADWVFHVLELLILGAPLWIGMMRLVGIMRDFPPHRHGSSVQEISYPRGYEPGKIVHLGDK